MRPKLSNTKELDDNVLVEQARNGDRRAFSVLVRRHQTVVYRSCYRILGDREDAKDASQEAFIRAYRKLDTFKGRSAFKTWLLRVAMNVSLNERSRREIPRADVDLARFVPGLETPETELTKSEEAAQIHEALRLVQPNHPRPYVPDIVGDIRALLAEILVTFILVFVVISVATDERAPAGVAPLAVGFALACGVLIAGPITGGSLNPARTLGPMIVAGQFSAVWVYIVGPILGAVLAALLYDRFVSEADATE